MPLTDNLCRDRVSDLDIKPAVTIPEDAAVRDAVAAMKRARTGCVIVEQAGRLSGIFTERDLLKRVIGRGGDPGARIPSVMTAQPASTTADESIADALQKMVRGGYRHLPVVDKRGCVMGRISVREIVRYMVEHFPREVYNLPPRPNQPQTAPEGA